MRLTSFTDFGLRMLMHMAEAPDKAHSTAALARQLDLSRHHLTKIMQRLSRAGIVETRRGGGGGARLAQPPAELRLGALVRLLEEGQPLAECFGPAGTSCTFDGRCGLRTRLMIAEGAFFAALDKSTLADIAASQPFPHPAPNAPVSAPTAQRF